MKRLILFLLISMAIPNTASAFIMLTGVEAHNYNNAINFTVNYGSSEYNPLMIGGVSIQAFMDLDFNQNTGNNRYPEGSEYAISFWRSDDNGQTFQFSQDSLYVRDVRNSFYGPITGTVPITNGLGSLFFSVPLEYLGDDDGQSRYRMELYETVSCPNCVGGISNEFRDYRMGTVAPEPSTILLLGMGVCGAFMRRRKNGKI